MNVITPSAVSEVLGMSLRWVYHHASDLGASRIGGTWIFTQEGLDDALQGARRMEGGGQGTREKKDKVVRIKEESGRVGGRGRKRNKGNEEFDRHGIANSFRKVS